MSATSAASTAACLRWTLDQLGVTVPAGRNGPVEIPGATRDLLAVVLGVMAFTRGVEVGVERGAYSETLCKANPDLELHAVDPWRAYRGYRDHVSQAKLDAFHEEACARLRPYAVRIHRAMSVVAADLFEDRSLDFVYLDGNHALEHVIADLAA